MQDATVVYKTNKMPHKILYSVYKYAMVIENSTVLRVIVFTPFIYIGN